MAITNSHPDPPIYPPRKVFTLLQLTESIRQAIQASTKGSWYWIRAEIAQIDKSGTGHYYLELIDNKNDQIRAKSRAMIWADDYARIKRELGDEVTHVLQTGTVIQCQVEISFHNVYGFSLHIKEVDLSFNLGELERKKQQTIKALQKAGIMDKNASLPLATIPQHIGIIGAPDSAGFADFVQQLLYNEEQYNFQIEVFPGGVQGEQAISSIIQRLDKADKKELDLIVLIRGGGSRMDLELFNNSEVAFKIAQMNTPLITGIGHETDTSVADLVAYHACKTPTAAAEFILEMFRDFERKIRRDTERIRMLAIRNLKTERGFFDTISERFSLRSVSYTQLERGKLHKVAARLTRAAESNLGTKYKKLDLSGSRIKQYARHLLMREKPLLHSNQLDRLSMLSKHVLRTAKQKLALAESKVHIQNPDRVLGQGYAIISVLDKSKTEGKTLLANDLINSGDNVNIRLINRDITATVNSVVSRSEKPDS